MQIALHLESRHAERATGHTLEVTADLPDPFLKRVRTGEPGSGNYLHDLFQRWAIAESIAAKVTRPEADEISELVAQGKVELGIVVSTQILTTPGVDFVGSLPPEIQHYIAFVSAVSASSKTPDRARELMKLLGSPRALAVIKAQGMEPGGGER